LDIKAADTRAKLQDYAVAVAMYEDIRSRPVNDFIKAQAAYEQGMVYLEQGRSAEAFATLTFAVENYPKSNHSYLALVELLEADVPVDDLDRGLVDYYAGEYGGGLAAFDRYLAEHAINDGTPHYFRALCLRALGSYEAAIDEYGYFIDNYSPHTRWIDAWAEKAETQWLNMGLYQAGADTLLEFVGIFPDSGASPEFLMAAARILERDAQLAEAAAVWKRVADEYPGHGQAPTAVFLSGIAHYRMADYESALGAFNRSLVIGVAAEDQARAYLWIGKTHHRMGDTAAAMTAWRQGLITDPGGYYSERIRDILSDRTPLATGAGELRLPDLQSERSDADAWVRLTFNLVPEADLVRLGPWASDPRFIRGTELWNLGVPEAARLEFEDLRESVAADPVASYQLANHLIELGLFRPAIFAARQGSPWPA
jgi:soluble lytic murein transglycosylase